MVQITIVGIVVIIIVIILFLLFKKPSINIEKEQHLYVLFNKPYYVLPHELIHLMHKLATSDADEFTHVLHVISDKNVPPEISFEEYFSLYSYLCTVEKIEQKDDSYELNLIFTLNSINKNER